MSGISNAPIPGLKPSYFGGLTIENEHGTMDVGPSQEWRSNMTTDRQGFYFNKDIFFPGGFKAFHQGNVENLRAALYERFHVRAEFAPGVGGGTPTGGVWETRPLNTVVENFPAGGATGSLSGSQVTLSAGKYRVFSRAPGFRVGRFHSRLLATAPTVQQLVLGSTVYSSNNNNEDTVIFGAPIELTEQTTMVLQTRCEYSLTDGMGWPFGYGGAEIYSELIFERVG